MPAIPGPARPIGKRLPRLEVKPATAPSGGHWFVYMLECRGGRLYTGITTDVARRLEEHGGGRRGARFTRAHPPAALRAVKRVANRSQALRLEIELKRLRRPGKLAWAARHAVAPPADSG